MKKIEIVGVPLGQAPEWVREEWVGLVLPLDEPSEKGFQMGVLGGLSENIGGYTVLGKVAIEHLEAKSPKAAGWWRENVSNILSASTHLVFDKNVCSKV